jgi:5-methylcytosine-specific restriction endonuclease McrBC regulatory subunit McrC
VLTPDVPENRVLGAALAVATAILKDAGEDVEHAVAVRYGTFFSDVSTLRNVDSRNALDQMISDLSTQAGSHSELHAALGAARPLLLYLGHDIAGQATSVAMRFFNLSALFESAVRRALANHLAARACVTAGRPLGVQLLQGSPFYVADPDVVITWRQSQVMVCDVKYKTWGRYPDHSDVYQLLSHCDGFGARTAVLIYPGNWALEKIGVTRGNVDLWRCAFEIEDLPVSASSLVQALAPGI